MRITDVECIHLRLPEIASEANGTQDALLVRVHTDAGIVGIGEVDSSPLVARAVIEAPMSHANCSGLRHLVVGEDPFEHRKIWRRMYQGTLYMGREGAVVHAMAGIDLALWDIMGKALQRPVHALLGATYRTQVRAYASILFGATPEATAGRGRALVARGFTAVKFGWGPFGQDTDQDEALVRAARSGVGTGTELLIDAGQCYDTKTAGIMARRLEPYDIYWLEEPLHPDNMAGYATLCAESPVRIAAGEAYAARASLLDLIELGGIDVIQVDVTRVGLTEARLVAEVADQRGIAFINHSYTTEINVAASMHLLATIPNAPFVEYCVEESPLRQELVRNPLPLRNGYVSLPEGPGLGIELDMDVVERYAVRP